MIALERGTGARGLRSVVEEVLDGVLFDAETGVRCVITEKTVRGEAAAKQSMSQTAAPVQRPCAVVYWGHEIVMTFAVKRLGISVGTRENWLDSDDLLCIVKCQGRCGAWCLFSSEKEMVMAVVARIIGYSLLTAGLGAGIGYALVMNAPDAPDWRGLSFVLACLGTIVGAVAGAAGEIVSAQHRIAGPKPQERKSRTCEAWD